jgi:hypothetical protein
MERRFMLPLLAVIALGVIILPETYALFSGQHNFYDTTQSGNQIPCEKCHSDILQELQQPGETNFVHLMGEGCLKCHITVAPNAEGLIQGPGGQFHAAATIACLDCHGATLPSGSEFHGPGAQCLTCHKTSPFSVPVTSASALQIFLPNETHKSFAEGAINSSLLKGANEACVGCHTHISVNITWTKPYAMTMKANVNNNGTWSINNMSGSGNITSHTSG